MTGAPPLPELAARLSDRLARRGSDLVDLVSRLARIESPSDEPSAQAPVFTLIEETLAPTGLALRRLPGGTSGGQLLARSLSRPRNSFQLLLGHVDTVWPIGTLASMPVREEAGRLYGPGVFDMKGGVAIAVFALLALADLEREIGVVPALSPVLFLNSDEELGSPDSARRIHHLARRAARAFVLEPAFGPEGRVKTERKGVARFGLRFFGRAAHAGLHPEQGASAIRELGRAIERLAALNDPDRGTTVNVGVVSGGTRGNVVAAEARAEVDVRFTSIAAGAEIEWTIRALAPTLPGVRIEVEGEIERLPLERTDRNRVLYARAEECAAALGLELRQASVVGGSDGSLASLHTATLDGLGAVGGGAHAEDEHLIIDRLSGRAALLALLLLSPAL
ncbi:MAG TPA: M20 family metallopeptidase [Thermoanaerobaculia bacterium]|nr:M20 family metallopeptidase [Thermoanaerobaculia bacterium]